MSEDNAVPDTAPKKKTKASVRRRTLWIAVPADIESLEVVDPEVTMPPELPDDDTPKPDVVTTPMLASYTLYAVPGGPGQKGEVKKILAKHNVDIRTIQRVRMFSGEKPFKIETQYNIRF